MMPENFRDVLLTKINEEENLPLSGDGMLAALDEYEMHAEGEEGDSIWEKYEDADTIWGNFLQYIKDSDFDTGEEKPEIIKEETPKKVKTGKKKTKKPTPPVEEKVEEEAPKPKKKPKKAPKKEEEEMAATVTKKKPKNKKEEIEEEEEETPKKKRGRKPKEEVEEEEETPKKKPKTKKADPDEDGEEEKPKKKPKAKAPTELRPGVVKAIVDKLKEGWTTKKDVHEHLCEEFPDRDAEKMKNTVNTQIHHKDMIRRKWNVEVKKGEGTEKLYRIKGAVK